MVSAPRRKTPAEAGTSRQQTAAEPGLWQTAAGAGGGEAANLEGAVAALEAARRHLLGLQHEEGWWKGELETNVTMDAEDLMLRHILGILDPDLCSRAARWIRSNQRSDGTWATFYGGPPDLSTTVEAYVALRLAGEPPEAPHMRRAASFVREQGGVASSRVFTRIWLAMLGAWDWEDLPVLPPEIMLLPPGAPLSIYDFACWARQTVVALSVVMAYRPSWRLPFGLRELEPGANLAARGAGGRSRLAQSGSRPGPKAAGPGALGRIGVSPARAFEVLDRLLHRYERLPGWVLPRRWLRQAALRQAEKWIVDRQEADGSWGGIQPPFVYSVIALKLRGYPLDHPVMAAALKSAEAFSIDDERGRRVEACQSPVWDTALAVIALSDAGVPREDPALEKAAAWLVSQEVSIAGDWAVRRPNLAPGGWAFEFENDNYPDIDDTAEVVMALRRAGKGEDACARAIAWTLGMQCREGGWGAFDVDNDSRLVAALPFCDFGEVTDPPSADVTAHVVEMLAAEPSVAQGALAAAVAWLCREQEEDGSWFGRWGVNHIYGTGAALPALVAAGVPPSDPRIRRAVRWLEDHQNADGGFGEDLRSYLDPAWRGRGASTASQTAWALLALVAAGEHTSQAATRAVKWLVANQTESGTWDEPWFTGTGFPWDFSINYHLYRLVFPVMALGRYLKAVSP